MVESPALALTCPVTGSPGPFLARRSYYPSFLKSVNVSNRKELLVISVFVSRNGGREMDKERRIRKMWTGI